MVVQIVMTIDNRKYVAVFDIISATFKRSQLKTSENSHSGSSIVHALVHVCNLAHTLIEFLRHIGGWRGIGQSIQIIIMCYKPLCSHKTRKKSTI